MSVEGYASMLQTIGVPLVNDILDIAARIKRNKGGVEATADEVVAELHADVHRRVEQYTAWEKAHPVKK